MSMKDLKHRDNLLHLLLAQSSALQSAVQSSCPAKRRAHFRASRVPESHACSETP
jgi:hypothetical protein